MTGTDDRERDPNFAIIPWLGTSRPPFIGSIIPGANR